MKLEMQGTNDMNSPMKLPNPWPGARPEALHADLVAQQAPTPQAPHAPLRRPARGAGCAVVLSLAARRGTRNAPAARACRSGSRAESELNARGLPRAGCEPCAPRRRMGACGVWGDGGLRGYRLNGPDPTTCRECVMASNATVEHAAAAVIARRNHMRVNALESIE